MWGLIESAAVADGDTVIIPTIGTPAHWVGAHTLNKAITIQGQGMPIIFDEYPTNAAWLTFKLVANKRTRITGIDWRCGANAAGNGVLGGPNGGTFVFMGTTATALSARIRFDHCNLTDFVAHGGAHVIFNNTTIGLIDHCTFIRENGGIYTYAQSWPDANGGSQDKGDGSWAFPTHWAEFLCMYVEDCVFDQSAGGQGIYFDGTWGGRIVVRHCTFNHGTNTGACMGHHGLEARNRSIRVVEYYNNYIDRMNVMLVKNRGGTGVVFNNRVNQAQSNGAEFGFQYDRGADPTFWGRASGYNKFDVNDNRLGGGNTTPNPPTPFWSGVLTSVVKNAGGAATAVTQAGAGWTPGEWTDYAFCDNTKLTDGVKPDGSNPGSNVNTLAPGGSVITGNDSDTLFLDGPQYQAQSAHGYNAGDSFDIRKVKFTLDSIGRAGTNMNALISGNYVMATGQNEQITEPYFFWNNKRGTAEIQVAEAIGYSNETQAPPGERHFYTAGNRMTIANGGAIDYPWSPGVPSVCGAKADSTGLPTYPGGTTMNVPLADSGGAPYPHPDTQTSSPAVISGPFSAAFTFGEANSVDIIATGNPTPVMTKSGALPSWATFSDQGGGVARISGTPTNTSGATITVIATNGIGAADSESFALTVNSPNQAPSIGSISKPTNNQTFVGPASIALEVSATDPENSMDKVVFYQAGNIPIASVTGPGPLYSATWNDVGQGSYSITAKAFDTSGGISDASSAVGVTVNPAAALQPPTIVVTA